MPSGSSMMPPIAWATPSPRCASRLVASHRERERADARVVGERGEQAVPPLARPDCGEIPHDGWPPSRVATTPDRPAEGPLDQCLRQSRHIRQVTRSPRHCFRRPLLVRHSPEATPPVATRSPSARRPVPDRQRERQHRLCLERPRGVPPWQSDRELPNPAPQVGGMLGCKTPCTC
jgi:hypothetical protein